MEIDERTRRALVDIIMPLVFVMIAYYVGC